MTEQEETIYIQGSRTAWLSMLNTCLRELGITDPVTQGAAYLAERADALVTLRRLCDEYGDNDWPDDLHLSDIIEKHLVRDMEK